MADRLQSLSSVLQDKRLVIEDYQRPYAWEGKQLRDLWDDLDVLGEGHHFAGTLVLRDTGERIRIDMGDLLNEFEVVDGQQRLATCMILLDQVRRRLEGLKGQGVVGVDDAASTVASHLHISIGGVKQPRLKLGAELQRYWAESILGDELASGDRTEGHERLLAARGFFDNRLSELVSDVSDETAGKRLLDLRARVSGQLQFLVYDIESKAEVGVIFETLNERGKSLTELEKVKNYLLYLARRLEEEMSDDLVAEINEAWKQVYVDLARVRVQDDAVLRNHWLATISSSPRLWSGINSIKHHFPRSKYVSGRTRLAAGPTDTNPQAPTQALYDDLKAYAAELRRCSGVLRDFHDSNATYPSFPDATAQRVRRASATLIRGGVLAPFYSLIMATRLTHQHDGELLAQVLELCETYLARVYVMGRFRTGAGQGVLHQAAISLYRGEDPQRTLDKVHHQIWQWASDDQLETAFEPGTDWYWGHNHKFLLYEYELAISRAPQHVTQYETFTNNKQKTTEHILPQYPAEGSRWTKDFTPEERSRLVNSLGNLVLTYDNSSYSNFEYARKRGTPSGPPPSYWTSQLAQEQEIARTNDVWTPAEITARGEKLKAWALYTRWPLNPPATVGPEELDARDEDVSDDPDSGGQG